VGAGEVALRETTGPTAEGSEVQIQQATGR
jgi:hypothetical protein